MLPLKKGKSASNMPKPKALAHKGYRVKRKVANPRNSIKPDEPVAQIGQSAADGLRAVRNEIKSLEGNYNKHLNEKLARVYVNAMLLRSDEDEWLSFCREAEWEDFPGKPKVQDQPDALRFAVRFAVGFPAQREEKLAATKRVSKLSSALKVLLDDQTNPKDVTAQLDKLGVEQLSQEAARRNKEPAAPTVWTLQFPEEKSAHILASMALGKFCKVSFRLEKADGMSGEAILRKIFVKSQKKAERSPL